MSEPSIIVYGVNIVSISEYKKKSVPDELAATGRKISGVSTI